MGGSEGKAPPQAVPQEHGVKSEWSAVLFGVAPYFLWVFTTILCGGCNTVVVAFKSKSEQVISAE